VDGLLPLDKVMLKAWYSGRMRAGATPFEALPVLADELVASLPDKAAAQQARDRFFARVIDQMQAFANGQGDVPAIVKRSGKATDDGIRNGRMEMSYFLGVAYLEGSTVGQDQSQAQRWLQRAATLGSRTAQTRLGAFR
jgi:TPR repeat protein